MSVAGLKKQFYKASQMVSEKVGAAEGTKMDDDFKDLERRADLRSKAVVEVLNKTTEYLQPDPATRAKLAMLVTVSRIRGQVTSPGYSQPEARLGDSMTKYGSDLGEESVFGKSLIDIGDSMKKVAEVKNSLDIDVKQNFIDPLHIVAEKEIKEIQQQQKKLENRRLDYDYKKKRQGKIPDEEIKLALDKFEESKGQAEIAMHNLLETDEEQISQLSSLVNSLVQYHKECLGIMEKLSATMSIRMSELHSHPKREYTPKPRSSVDYGEPENSNGGLSSSATRTTVSSHEEPRCRALYDFEPENEGELGFRDGDIITLTGQLDENWLEGKVHGKEGYFPTNYVEVIVPLPH
ncbi:endophilin-A2-like isoform X2 [Antennarius striatus]|uniref:endophilin-A2-like isoform X2 n=1 Tax=Antennarius striatus TaxID=241820 RepID=UPI0035B29D21